MQICDAERHAMHSDAGASATIISTIVRRSALHAVLDALRPLCQVEQKAGHTFIISTHSVGMYRSGL